MPAKLDLLPRKKFEITLEDGTVIKGQFGTWALKRFTEKRNIGLEGLYDVLTKLDIGTLTEFILCGIEQTCREDKKPFDYTDVDLCKWADELNGMPTLVDIFNHYGSEEGEKKSNQMKEELPSPGQASSESQQAAA